MCGRFTNRLTWREIVALYRLTVPATPEQNLPARYNICPTTTIDAVIERNAKRELVRMRWGLVPSWWKKPAKETPSTFNARAETVAEKPTPALRQSGRGHGSSHLLHLQLSLPALYNFIVQLLQAHGMRNVGSRI
jgi:putative SOS response-associated peptidase YedK